MTFFKKNNSGQFIGVEFSEYKGKKYINIREYYTNADDEKRPTRKGVTFSADSLPSLVSAVNSLVTAGSQQNKTTGAREKKTATTIK